MSKKIIETTLISTKLFVWRLKIAYSGRTRQSKHCGFCIYLFDNSFDQSKSMVRLVRAEKMILSGLVFAKKIARMILIQNI